MKPRFFPTPEDFRAWFEKNHGTADQLLVGFYKKDCGKPSITWPESVDEALCFGWIDGIRKRVDDDSYTIRFTPRKQTSNWSKINIKRVEELTRQGRMRPAGLKAFESRREYRSGIYSYENRSTTLDEPYAGILEKNEVAASFFQAQTPFYRKTAIWWIVSAKKEETRLKRLAQLIELSEAHEMIPGFIRTTSKSGTKPKKPK